MICNIESICLRVGKKDVNQFYNNNIIIILRNLQVNEVTKAILKAKTCLIGFCAFNACVICALLVLLQIPCTCAVSTIPVLHEPKFGERLFPLQRNKIGNDQGKIGIVYNNSSFESNQENYQGKSESERTHHSTLPNEILGIFDEYETLLAPSSSSPSHSFNHGEDFVTVKKSHLVNVSKADRFGMSTEYFLVPTNPRLNPTPSPVDLSRNIVRSSSAPILRTKSKTDINESTHKLIFQNSRDSHTDQNIKFVPKYNINHNSGSLRKEPWVVPVLVLASLSMLMMAAFEIFVLFKAWRTSPSRRHLFLGQMLLLGLFSCAGLAAVITAQPTLFTCGILRFGVGVSYALVYASLLVKCVFLISLNGGVYLPAPYQGLLLLFAVLIQVAVGTQWLLTQPPDVYSLHVPTTYHVTQSAIGSSTTTINNTSIKTLSTKSADRNVSKMHISLLKGQLDNTSNSSTSNNTVTTVLLCKSQFLQLLFSLSYIFCLIIFVAILAAKSRGIRDNYREATYIGLAIGSSIPIWLGWMLCGLAVSERHKDASIAFGLVATSVLVFLVMFMPKSRQLAAMGKEGLYVEDREEEFSSLGRAGSGYSPSFFHFKPIKYGMMSGGCGTTDVALNNGNVNETINGMRNKHVLGQTCNANENNLYTTLEPTLSSNPNVYFHRGGVLHPGMMY